MYDEHTDLAEIGVLAFLATVLAIAGGCWYAFPIFEEDVMEGPQTRWQPVID